jgi:hypothetical protein
MHQLLAGMRLAFRDFSKASVRPGDISGRAPLGAAVRIVKLGGQPE